MSKLGISAISHTPCLYMLEGFLQSLKCAIGNRNIPVSLLFSVENETDNAVEAATEIARKVGLKGLILNFNSEKHTIGKLRNISYSHLPKNVEWIITADGDTKFGKNNISHIEHSLESLDLTNVGALCGSIGVLQESHPWGKFEAFIEAKAILTKVDGYKVKELETMLRMAEKIPSVSLTNLLNKKTKSQFQHLSGKQIKTFQSYCGVINHKVYERRGFNAEYGSADDRELAAFLDSAGLKILFIPEHQVFHDFKVGIEQLCKRKEVHGIWLQRIREDYKGKSNIFGEAGLKPWHTESDDLDYSYPFNTEIGASYLLLSDASYKKGCLHVLLSDEKNVEYIDHRDDWGKSRGLNEKKTETLDNPRRSI